MGTYESSTETADYGKKPRIKKGYYPAKLIEVKEREKEGKYGKQEIFLFRIYDPTTKQVLTYNSTDNRTDDVILAQFINVTYKDEKTGEYRSAFTPKSRGTKVLMALGWEGPGNKITTEDFVGKWAEVNIDDYEATVEIDGESTKQTVSTIKDISALHDWVAPEEGKTEEAKPEEKAPEVAIDPEKLTQLKQMKADGLLSERGYNDAIEALKAKR